MANITPDELLDDLVTNNQDAAEIFNKLRDYVNTDSTITFNLSTGDVTVDSLPKQIDAFNNERDAAFKDFTKDFTAPSKIPTITRNSEGFVTFIETELESGFKSEETINRNSSNTMTSIDVVIKDAQGNQTQSFTRTINRSGGEITGVS